MKGCEVAASPKKLGLADYGDLASATHVAAIHNEVDETFPIPGLLWEEPPSDFERRRRAALDVALSERLAKVELLPAFARFSDPGFRRAREHFAALLKRQPTIEDELRYLNIVCWAVYIFESLASQGSPPRHHTKRETRQVLKSLRAVADYLNSDADEMLRGFDHDHLRGTTVLMEIERKLQSRLASERRSPRNDASTLSEVFVRFLAKGFLTDFQQAFPTVIADLCAAVEIDLDQRTITDYVRKARSQKLRRAEP